MKKRISYKCMCKQKLAKKVQLIFVFIFTLTYPVYSQWEKATGPFGGLVMSLGVDKNTGYVYAGTSSSGIYISKDNGINWENINNDLDGGPNASIASINIYNGKVYISNVNEIYVSANNGANWTRVGEKFSGSIQCINFCGNNILAGTQHGIYLKAPNNNSWISVNNGLNGKNVRCMGVIGNNIFAGTNSGVFLSTNNGESWQAMNNGLPSTEVLSMVIDGNNIIIGTMEGIYLSNNNGISWTLINTGLPTQYCGFWSLAVNENNIFAAAEGEGVYLSTNNGNNWNKINNGFPSDKFRVRSLIVNGSTVFAASNIGGIYKTNDNGSNWTLSNTGLISSHITCIAKNGTNIYVGTFDGSGVFISNDNGNSWSAINNGLPIHSYFYVNSILVKDNTIFIASNEGLYLSNNNGNNWVRANNNLPADIRPWVITSNENTIFLGTNKGVYFSTDNGSNWVFASSDLSNIDIQHIIANGQNIFAGTYHEIYKSTDNGSNWTQLNGGFSNFELATFAIKNNIIYAGTRNGGIFKSNDNGTTWIESNNGLAENETVESIAFNDEYMFLSANGAGFYCSIDNGEHWAEINYNLKSTLASCVTLNGNFVFGGMYSGGVVKSPLSDIKVLSVEFHNSSDLSDDQVYMDIISNTTWTIKSDQSWETVSPSEGSGTVRTIVTAEKNPLTSIRTAIITISGNGVSEQEWLLTQTAGEPELNVSTNSISIDAAANSTGTFDITSNTDWTIQCDQSWLSVSASNGTNNMAITVTALENTTVQNRSATITASANGVSNKTITVTQNGITPILNVSTNSISIDAAANSIGTFDITSNTDWAIQCDQSWLSVSASNGTNNMAITVTAQENTTVQDRSATITVSANGVLSKTIIITQNGITPILNVSTNSISINANANSSETFNITSNLNWAITCDATWININHTSGSDNGSIELTVDANTALTERTATITVSATGVTAKTVILKQAGSIPAGISNDRETAIKLSPNPVIDKLLIEIPDFTIPLNIKIISVNGGQSYNSMITEPSTIIDMSNYKAGTYIVKIYGSKEIMTRKIVKNK